MRALDDAANTRWWRSFRARHPEASLWVIAIGQASAMFGFHIFLRLLVS